MPYLPFEKELYILKLDFSHSPILQLLFHHNIHVEAFLYFLTR